MIGGDMITYRPDIQVLDATIRDGGLVNDFYFSDEFVKALYESNIRAGVDYMEFGYKASKEMFDVNKFGKWKFCNEEDIRAIVGENNTDLKISVMADVGRCDFKKDIIPKSESVIDLIRVATYINTMPAAIEMIEDAHAKGYETTCNIMAISKSCSEVSQRETATINFSLTLSFQRHSLSSITAIMICRRKRKSLNIR